MKISLFSIKKSICFFLPTMIILSQWISVAGIRMSWILSILFLFHLFLRHFGDFRYDNTIIIFSFITLVIPILNFWLGIADGFNGSLYISIGTGLITFCIIILMSAKLNETLWKGILFSCIVFTVWGVYEILTGNYILSTNKDFILRNNVFGTHYPIVAFPNTNDLAQYLCGLFPVCFYYYFKKKPFLLCAAIAPVVFVIYCSDSRLSMILFVVGMLLPIIVRMLTTKDKGTLMKMLCVVGILVIVFGIIEARTGVIGNIYSNLLYIDSSANYYQGRSGMYNRLIEVGLKNPFGGFGSSYLVNTLPPHNLLLFIFVDYGWLPLALFILFYIYCMKKMFLQTKNEREKILYPAMLVSLLIFLFFASISSCNEQRKVVWILLALAVRCVRMSSENKVLMENEVYNGNDKNTEWVSLKH